VRNRAILPRYGGQGKSGRRSKPSNGAPGRA
jgi:hypothetical protein